MVASSSAYLAKEFTHRVTGHSKQRGEGAGARRRRCKQGIVLEDDGLSKVPQLQSPEARDALSVHKSRS